MPYQRTIRTPLEGDLELLEISNSKGLRMRFFQNGALFAIEHEDDGSRIILNQMLGSPLCFCVMRILLRAGGGDPFVIEAAGAGARGEFGGTNDRVVWQGVTKGVHHKVTLWLHPAETFWLWRIDLKNQSDAPIPCDAILVQDVGLGERGYIMNNEAYASHYIDHTIGSDPRFGPVIMSRQNMAQAGRHPWLAHGCLEGATSFATDAIQLFGPSFRDASRIGLPFGISLPGIRLQHEAACACLQSSSMDLEARSEGSITFFGLFEPDHPEPACKNDLLKAATANTLAASYAPCAVQLAVPVRNVLQDAPPLVSQDAEAGKSKEPRHHEEWRNGRLISYFLGQGAGSRHIVLRNKDRLMKRRHGTILKSGQNLLPSETALCATCWMHGVFAAQLAAGNTSLHRLLSVSRDSYNIIRASGLRILAELGSQWHLLAIPSSFEMGLSDCRWTYRTEDRIIIIDAVMSGDDPAMQWQIMVEGEPCRFLILAHLTLGEHDFANAGLVEIDNERKRLSFHPDASSLWSRTYPEAVYHIVTSTPEAVDALGGDELLFEDGRCRRSPVAILRTEPLSEFRFAAIGSMHVPRDAGDLVQKYEKPLGANDLLRSARTFWTKTIGDRDGCAGLDFDTLFPWLIHNAVIHLSVPHGLEQYSGGAWGTRDVCQGPVELLLALGHYGAARELLRRVYAKQIPTSGDWPQWFMLEPYGSIGEPSGQCDIILWPLKALCDYVEASHDFAFLSEEIAWRGNVTGHHYGNSVRDHVDALLNAIERRFLSGTHLLRYGEGDWNDTLQPADSMLKEKMVSSWAAALLFQQLHRYSYILRKAGRESQADCLEDQAENIRADFNRYLIRDGVAAGYAVFGEDMGRPELLLHPSDRKTGVSYSLIPMTCAITGGLFSPEQTHHHLNLIREHLLYPDGVRLMDKPIAYHGGAEHIFRRAESAAFFGREVGLMYVHAHLRYCEALRIAGQEESCKAALQLANPITVTGLVRNASLRQRNCYFSSSDPAFNDRYEAVREWKRVSRGTIGFDAGWRIYSSGPGLFVKLLSDTRR